MMRYSLTRRTLLKSTLAASLVSMLPSGLLLAGDQIDHPVKGGIAGIKPAQCPNCGMSIQMWFLLRGWTAQRPSILFL